MLFDTVTNSPHRLYGCVASHQWLKQMQEQHHFIIYLYDNQESLYYERLQDSHWEDLRNAVLKKCGTDIFTGKDEQTIAQKN